MGGTNLMGRRVCHDCGRHLKPAEKGVKVVSSASSRNGDTLLYWLCVKDHQKREAALGGAS